MGLLSAGWLAKPQLGGWGTSALNGLATAEEGRRGPAVTERPPDLLDAHLTAGFRDGPAATHTYPLGPASRHPPRASAHFRSQVGPGRSITSPAAAPWTCSPLGTPALHPCPTAAPVLSPTRPPYLPCDPPTSPGALRGRPPSPLLSSPAAAFYKRGQIVRCNDNRYWSEPPTSGK